MSRKGIDKMSIRILQLCLVLVLTFKEFVKFCLAAQLLKLRLLTKPSLKQISRQQPFAYMIFGFVLKLS